MNLQKSLDFLYGLQRFGIKLGLENIRVLLERLGNPHSALPIVQVAGTNGKGSVCATLAEILGQAGYRVGLYTSPHLQSFTERIRVAGEPIGSAEVHALIEEIRQVTIGLPITFFEFTTAMALLHFQRRQTDAVVLEVGMGGRLDATSVVEPQLGIITPISFDHTEHLGTTLTAIAAEKAGILKRGMPVVVAEQPPEALQEILRQARLGSNTVCLANRDYLHDGSAGFDFDGLGLQLEDLRPGLVGIHQHGNMAAAIAAAVLLRQQGWTIPDAALRAGVAEVFWPGRLEWWRKERSVLLDGAHNPAGARVLSDYLQGMGCSAIHWVVGAKGDKALPELLAPILPYVGHLYAVPLPIDRHHSPAEIVACGEGRGVPGSIHDSCAEGLQAALNRRKPGEIVLVAGSLFLVAAARDYLMALEDV